MAGTVDFTSTEINLRSLHSTDRLDAKLHVSNEEYYKWEGKTGFMQYGLPAISKSVGVLGTVVSGGTFALFAGTAYWGIVETIWSGSSTAVSAYNTFGHENRVTNVTGGFMDFKDATLESNPVSIINLIMYGANSSLNNGEK